MGQSPSRRASTAAIYVGKQARIINLYFAKLCHLTAINSVKLEAKAIIYKKEKAAGYRSNEVIVKSGGKTLFFPRFL